MIYLDTTSASSWRHASGLARVSRRLGEELGASAVPSRWPQIAREPGASDWVLTPELFSEPERPGFTAFLDRRPCRLAAIYHDAIPMKFPRITWPASVERHAGYMKLLARFDRVWAVSRASRDELLGLWKWQGVSAPPPVDVLSLGADWPGVPRATSPAPAPKGAPRIVSVGILEPRKNQSLLIDACEALWEEGSDLELHLVGRVNPHFGGATLGRVKAAARRWPGMRHHAGLSDAELAKLLLSARATAFASLAEGYGLPLLESLWLGVPCVCSDIAPLAENAAGGGCLVVPGNAPAGWIDALRRILGDGALHARLSAEARGRALPTWSEAAGVLRSALA